MMYKLENLFPGHSGEDNVEGTSGYEPSDTQLTTMGDGGMVEGTSALEGKRCSTNQVRESRRPKILWGLMVCAVLGDAGGSETNASSSRTGCESC
jgi:hypothetical protein